MQNWKKEVRATLLNFLRPGRNMHELIALISRAEAIQSEEHRRMLRQLITFGEVRVRELMVPRSDIRAVATDMDIDLVADKFTDAGFSRMPAYKDDLDHISGIAYAKDVFIAVRGGGKVPLSDILRPCLRVPESQRLLGLLSQMKHQGSHIAILLDEYGGTEGLVTLSDLLAEIVGPIEDADDAVVAGEWTLLDDGSYDVQTSMHVEELECLLGVRFPEGDYDTVAGLILGLCGRIPVRGERLEVAGMRLTVLEAEPKRLLKVHIEKPSSIL